MRRGGLPPPYYWHFARSLAAVVLIGAGGLKLTASAPIADSSTLLAWPHQQFFLAGYEVALGLWLLSGWLAVASRQIAMLTMAVFSVASGYLGLVGIARCGCLGDVPASPWYLFVTDVVLLIVLTVCRPRYRPQNWRVVLGFAPAIGVGVILLTVGYALCCWQFGTLGNAVAYARGQRVIAEPAVLDFGTATVGSSRERQVVVRNLTAVELRVVGGTVDCACTAIDDLPISIPPGGHQAVTIRLRFVGSGGVLSHSATLTTDAPDQPPLHIHLSGRISTSGTVPDG